MFKYAIQDISPLHGKLVSHLSGVKATRRAQELKYSFWTYLEVQAKGNLPIPGI